MAEARTTLDLSSHIPRRDLLLKTKLHIPPARPDLIPRPRLIERLSEGLTRPLTLISAPAGFGKTTLLSEWIAALAHSNWPVAWLSLDERDNDPYRFWTYLIAALDTLNVSDIESILSPLSLSEPLPEDDLTALIDKILADVSSDIVLVLDDYHLITAQPIHDALIFLLNHCPPHMHLVIASRTAPPFPLAQFRARGQLTELRANDLRFTADETSAFLNRNIGLKLPAKDIAALQARTEGWIAGLQLAALSMRERDNPAEFIQAFGGTHHYIVDYLAEQVLYQQFPNIQTFLLETSILERFTGSLCDAVTEQEHSQAKLEWLERANLFLVPLDDERRWYRYHHLFADFLRERLRQSRPDRWAELHRRAADWCERNGWMEEAIRHALEAKESETAIRLIEQVVESLWQHSEVLTLFSWMKALPDELVRSRPGLCIYAGWAFALTGRLDAVEPFLQSVDMHIKTTEPLLVEPAALSPDSYKVRRTATQPAALRRETLAWLAAADILRAFVARFQGNVSDAITFGRRALERVTAENLEQRGHALLSLGHAYLLGGATEAARRTLGEAVAATQASGFVATYLSAINYLAQLDALQGRLHDAMAVYQSARKFVAELKQPHLTGVEHVGIGDVLREWNDLEAASHYINEGLHLAELSGDWVHVREAYLARARLEQAQGNLDSALFFIQKVEQIARRSSTSADIALMGAWQARLRLAQGNRAAAEQWAQTCGLSAHDDLSFLHEFSHLTLARVLLAQDKPGDAERLLERLLQSADAKRAGRIGRVIEILLLQALALQTQGKVDEALTVLTRALTLAEPEGYIRVFVDEGEPMAALLGRIKAQDSHRWAGDRGERLKTYIHRLLAAFSKTKAVRPPAIVPQPLLSERELEVLHLIAEGKSYQEIAKELVITLSTVQTYIRKIYPKLDAHSGLEAVARAREIRLL